MDLNRVRQRLDEERRYLVRDGESLHVFPHLTRGVLGSRRWVSWSSLPDGTADNIIAQELANHRGGQAEFEWKLYSHDAPSDLPERLKRHGLLAGASESVMVYDLLAGPPLSTQAPDSGFGD